MATAAREVRSSRVIQGKHFSLGNPPLTVVEQRVYDSYCDAAANGSPAPSIEELAREIGATGVATVPGITKRLEEKGYITRQVYQRGRMVCIVATGQCTLPPKDQTPHWRTRTDRVPAPAIQAIRQRMPSTSAEIERDARERNISLQQHLEDLVYIGHHGYRAEKECDQ